MTDDMPDIDLGDDPNPDPIARFTEAGDELANAVAEYVSALHGISNDGEPDQAVAMSWALCLEVATMSLADKHGKRAYRTMVATPGDQRAITTRGLIDECYNDIVYSARPRRHQ